MSKTKCLLVAVAVATVAFTLSCSLLDELLEDDENSYPSCAEAERMSDNCYYKYESEYDACYNDACWDNVDYKYYQCVIDKVCGSNSVEDCNNHFVYECGWE